MKLRLHGIIKVVRLILPMIVVKGDGKSQDNLAGRYASHHPSVGRLSWCCNIKPRDSRYPWHECSYINAASTYKMCLNALGLNENQEKLTEQDVDYQERDNDTFSTLIVSCVSVNFDRPSCRRCLFVGSPLDEPMVLHPFLFLSGEVFCSSVSS